MDNEDMDFLTFETKIINKIGPKLNEIKSPSSFLNEILEYLETLEPFIPFPASVTTPVS